MYAHEIIEIEAKEKGCQQERKKTIIRLWQYGMTISMIANIIDVPVEQVEPIIANYQIMLNRFLAS